MKPPVAAASGSSTASLVRRVAIAAALIAVGNIASRVLGLARESVIAGLLSCRGTSTAPEAVAEGIGCPGGRTEDCAIAPQDMARRHTAAIAPMRMQSMPSWRSASRKAPSGLFSG